MENEFCPCCGRRCPLSNPSCERGEAYAKSGGQQPPDGHDAHGEHEPHEHGHHHHHRHGEHHHKH